MGEVDRAKCAVLLGLLQLPLAALRLHRELCLFDRGAGDSGSTVVFCLSFSGAEHSLCPWEGTSVALSSAPDESDYQTEFEEELPDISKETYADFQSTGIESDSDSVRCWALLCQCTSVVPTLRSPDRACPQTLPLQVMQPGTWQLLDIS